jgi:hypothetical protein
MKSFKLKGKVVEVSEGTNVGEYKKREVIIEVESGGDFGNTNVCLVAWNERADSLDDFNSGDIVTAEFRPKSIKSKKGSWFSNLNLANLEKEGLEKASDNSDNEDCPF